MEVKVTGHILDIDFLKMVIERSDQTIRENTPRGSNDLLEL